jgi:hypothetical protein
MNKKKSAVQQLIQAKAIKAIERSRLINNRILEEAIPASQPASQPSNNVLQARSLQQATQTYFVMRRMYNMITFFECMAVATSRSCTHRETLGRREQPPEE